MNDKHDMYFVYDRPADHGFMVRRLSIHATGEKAGLHLVSVGPTLDRVRKVIPRDFTCLAPTAAHDPSLVEIWL